MYLYGCVEGFSAEDKNIDRKPVSTEVLKKKLWW